MRALPTGNAVRSAERASRATFSSGLKSLAFPSGPRNAFDNLVTADPRILIKVAHFHAFENVGAVVEA
jgi:hypothetical protein